MGVAASIISETFPPKSKFHLDDIPDLTGKVMLVTGGSAGIGKDTTRALLNHNAKVYIASYNEEKAAKAISNLKQETGKEAFFIKLDLADLNSCRAAAEEFKNKEKELHVLFNNAGVFHPPLEQLTVQGYDLVFGVHVLGHFHFTQLLLPVLLAGAASSPDKKARIVNTSSSASLMVKSINLNTLKDTTARRKMGKQTLYAQSKLLARRYGDQGIVSISLNPGNIRSDIQRHLSTLERSLLGLVLYDPPYGPLTQLYAGTALEAAEFNGKYLIPWARVGAPGVGGRDSKLAGQLWLWLEEQVALHTR